MKLWLAFAFGLWLGSVLLGWPGIGPPIQRAPLPGTTLAVLPMRFGHDDHLGLPCAGCHHEFVDATTGPPCLTCHVTDVKVSPLLREQFHQLCQSCHTETRTRGQASGPMRRCGDCHVPDTEF